MPAQSAGSEVIVCCGHEDSIAGNELSSIRTERGIRSAWFLTGRRESIRPGARVHSQMRDHPPPPPPPWQAADIGVVGLAGRASFEDGTLIVNGAGAGIGGTDDACYFV
jgi:hypothetical protein